MLLRSSYAGEAVRVNDLVRIHVLEVHDKKVKLGLEAPEYVSLVWEKRAGQRLRSRGHSETVVVSVEEDDS